MAKVTTEAISLTIQGEDVDTDTCTTDTNGNCSITIPPIWDSEGSVTLTVDDVSHASMSYDPSANHDPDGDDSKAPS